MIRTNITTDYDTAMLHWRERLRGQLIYGRILQLAKNRAETLADVGITPKILLHPDGPALIDAILILGVNLDTLASDTWLTHQAPDDIIASISAHAVGDVPIDPVHDPPDPF